MNASRWIIVVALLAGLDQLSKWLVENQLPFQRVVDLLPVLGFYRTYNEGIAFSFLSSLNDTVLIIFTLLVIGFIIWLWRALEPARWISSIGYALVLGGAIGNLIDRVLLGKVVDFILFHTEDWSFAVFNLADSFITVGAVAIILDEIIHARITSHKEVKQGEDDHE